mmetsp:Transcript_26511/g.30552  ORF Transcript_26511/g.30552 Transcript_26511/m.30552 type:complete len:130 (-) Transcript_26511:667-1056(-)
MMYVHLSLYKYILQHIYPLLHLLSFQCHNQQKHRTRIGQQQQRQGRFFTFTFTFTFSSTKTKTQKIDGNNNIKKEFSPPCHHHQQKKITSNPISSPLSSSSLAYNVITVRGDVVMQQRIHNNTVRIDIR